MKFKIIFLLLILSLNSYAKEKILIVESYHKEYQWDICYKKGLMETLGDKYDYLTFEMDTKRLPRSMYTKRAELAYRYILKTKPKLVILGDDNALKYVGPRLRDSETLVVYLGVNNNPRYYGMAGYKNISGVLERPIMRRSIVHMSNFIEMKKVLVLFDTGETADVLKKESFMGMDSLNIGDVRVDIETVGKIDNWKGIVKNSKKRGYDVIFVGLYHTITDSKKKHVPADEVIKWTSKNSPVPLFGFWDFSVGPDKTIGGYVLLAREQGVQAGKIALKLLSNEDKQLPIRPVVAERGRFLFSKKQLKKWNIKIKGINSYEFTE